MKRKVKMILAAALAVACAGGGAFLALRPASVEVMELSLETVTLTFTETGSYEYSRQFSVYPLVAGEILQLAVTQGDRVEAGDILLVVSASDYEYQIQQLHSTITGYQGQIANLQLQEQQERVNLDATRQGLEGQLLALDAEIDRNLRNADSLERQISIQERIVSINRSNVSNARDYLRDMRKYGDDYEVMEARNAYNTAQGALAANQLLLEQLREGVVPEDIYEGQRRAIEAEIEAIGKLTSGNYTGGMVQYYNAQIAAAQSSIAQLEERAGQAVLTAPVGGVLSTLAAKDQNLLTQQAPAAVIGGDPLVEVFVPVREIDGVGLGDVVELKLDRRLGSETVAGTVVEVDGEARVMRSALGVEERKVRVLIQPAQSGALQIGYDLEVRFSPYAFPDVLVVPKTALFTLADGDHVWLVRDGKLVLCPVRREVETRDGYVITEGLAPGDLVVADADANGLRAGRRVAAA